MVRTVVLPSSKKYQTMVLDTLLREACFARDGYKCIRCGKTERLAPSHIYPKGSYRKMKYILDNVKTLCYYCHMEFWHKNPIEAYEWLQTAISKERLDHLRLCALVVDKTPFDFNAIKIILEMAKKKFTSRLSDAT